MTRRAAVLALARSTVIEARRTRLPWTAVCVLGALVACAAFARELALIQSERMATIVYAALARAAVIGLVAVQVCTSITREAGDRTRELVLAADITRTAYLLGRYAGFVVVASLLACALALPLLVLVPHSASVLWGLSLALEAAVIAAVALFAATALRHLTPALAFVVAFYVLARTLTGFVANSGEGPAHAPATAVFRIAFTALAYVVPPLEAWTRTAWLVDAVPALRPLADIALEALVYVAFVLSAAAFDFRRREL